MRLVIELAGNRHEVELAQAADEATLADVVEHVGGLVLDPRLQLWVDDRRHVAGDLVRDVTLLEGSRIARTPHLPPGQVASWSWRAIVSGGIDAGREVLVPEGQEFIIGRSREADLTVSSGGASARHVSIRTAPKGILVADAGSTNGTLLNGKETDGGLVTDEAIVALGGTVVTLRLGEDEGLVPPPGTVSNLTSGATAPFNRPPRPGLMPGPDTIDVPKRKPETQPTRFGVAALVAPLLMAGVMVAVMGDPRFALLALLSPVMVVGTYVEQKHRHKKDTAKEEQRFGEAIEEFEQKVTEAAAVELARRRERAPDPATVIRRAALPSTRLWQRRIHHADFLALHAGIGNLRWEPPVEPSARKDADDKVKKLLAESRLNACSIEVDLSEGGVVGIVGYRAGALAVARSLLCQAAVHCGPADLTVGVFCDQGRDEDWSWTGWLPHVRRHGEASGGRWLSSQRDRSEAMLRSLRDAIEGHPTPAVLLLLDSEVLTEGRDSAARDLLGHGRRKPGDAFQERKRTQVSGIVLAASAEDLPASCTSVIDVGYDAAGSVTWPGERIKDKVTLAGISLDTAIDCATYLSRFDDPELKIPGAGLPALVHLPPLLGMREVSAEAIRRSWSAARGVSTPLGIGEGGSFEIDLVRDGPHGLVGGTTGSGKSEFLRSVVAGLAARNDPTKLTFILIDFKGGAAFKTCERLPHTIGTVSNLDEQMAMRALTALEAELRYRQRVFARAGEGVDNLDAYLATNPTEPMPRLLLVIDEFAMLAKDYPDVLKSLVSVAAVGRTLGVHMILATQRPAGVVNEDILANTNLRVALRVQGKDDSTSVVGVPHASAIGRTQWGRAYIKLGQDDITPVQTALVTGRSEARATSLVDVHPVHFGVERPKEVSATADKDAPTDLDNLIDAIVEASAAAGIAPPRPVWPEPLGERVSLACVGAPEGDPTIPSVPGVRGLRIESALADDPDGQRQAPIGWDLSHGNLLVLGIPGSGTTTALSSIGLSLAAAHAPDDLDLLVLDMGSGELAPLAELPHTTGYVGSGAVAREQQIRFLRYLRTELDRRKSTHERQRPLVVLVDGMAALKDEYDDFDGMAMLEGLYRAYADGPDVGIHVALSSSRAKSVPSQIDDVTTQKWLFRLADTYDYSAAGVSPKLAPPPVPGRFVDAATRLHAHVATPSVPLDEAVHLVAARWGTGTTKRTVVGQLPKEVTVAELGEPARLVGEPWRIPVGVRESDLETGVLEVFEGEHIQVAGPPRSGKSTLLLAMAEAIREGARGDGVDVAVWGVCGRRSPLKAAGLDRCVVGDDELPALLAQARIHEGPLVLLIDDAEQFDDSDQSISGIVSGRTTDLLVIAAGRSDDLRSMFGHWTKKIQKARCGVLLQPNVDFDGDLVGVNLPRKAPVEVTQGRGYMAAGGVVDFVQCARPSGGDE